MLFKRAFVIIISTLILCICTGSVLYAESNTQTEKQVEQKRLALKQKIISLTKLERRETNKLSRNQQKLENNQRELQISKDQYTKKQTNIVKLQKELDSYLEQYNKRNKASAERIRCIYKNQHTLILDLLLSTSSISDFLDRIYYQNLIIQSDKKKMKTLREEAKRISYLKSQLESEKRQLSGIIKNIDKENATIENTIRQNKIMIEKIQNDKRAYERSERDLQRLSKNLTSMISKNTKHSDVIAHGGFILPVDGARISSPYGGRIHPIFKTRIFHTGIDYAVPLGTPIKASNEGKVIYSGWYGGYGKVVIIDHGFYRGAPTTTLYAHMLRQNVSVGNYVKRGQIIGYVGSTGYSTGPHVHFEVRINGKHQNPSNYL